jgi:hypothetical protein
MRLLLAYFYASATSVDATTSLDLLLSHICISTRNHTVSCGGGGESTCTQALARVALPSAPAILVPKPWYLGIWSPSSLVNAGLQCRATATEFLLAQNIHLFMNCIGININNCSGQSQPHWSLLPPLSTLTRLHQEWCCHNPAALPDFSLVIPWRVLDTRHAKS